MCNISKVLSVILTVHSLRAAPGLRGAQQTQSSSLCQRPPWARPARPRSSIWGEEHAGKPPDPLQLWSHSSPRTSWRYLRKTNVIWSIINKFTCNKNDFSTHEELINSTVNMWNYVDTLPLTNVGDFISHHVFIVVDSGIWNIRLVSHRHNVQFLKIKKR